MTQDSRHGSASAAHGVEFVPAAAVRLFQLSWQLESWLRMMAYVELRAAVQDWEGALRPFAGRDWPPRALEADRRMSHMATAHEMSLSYISFGQLCRVITSDEHWRLFEPYFPPRDNTTARIDEIQTIRNRIAHFRRPHENDTARFELFLRDMEAGIRRFCRRYHHPSLHPRYASCEVVRRLESEWRRTGWAVELSHPGGWLHDPSGRRDPNLHATLSIYPSCRRGVPEWEGAIFRLGVSSRASEILDVVNLVNNATTLGEHLIHVLIHGETSVAFTIAAVSGEDRVVEVVARLLELARNETCARTTWRDSNRYRREEWPEYVLRPHDVTCVHTGEETDNAFDYT